MLAVVVVAFGPGVAEAQCNQCGVGYTCSTYYTAGGTAGPTTPPIVEAACVHVVRVAPTGNTFGPSVILRAGPLTNGALNRTGIQNASVAGCEYALPGCSCSSPNSVRNLFVLKWSLNELFDGVTCEIEWAAPVGPGTCPAPGAPAWVTVGFGAPVPFPATTAPQGPPPSPPVCSTPAPTERASETVGLVGLMDDGGSSDSRPALLGPGRAALVLSLLIALAIAIQRRTRPHSA